MRKLTHEAAMTKVLLLHAGPTLWDMEDRIVGRHSLPLSDEAVGAIQDLVKGLGPNLTAIYRDKTNEACNQAANILSARYKIKPGHNQNLQALNLGLWEGLTRDELRFRSSRVFAQWLKQPLAVNPPEGETLEDAIQRLQNGLGRILKRTRGVTLALVVRSTAMQILSGLLKQETPEMIASHLHNVQAMETIEIPDEKLYEFMR